jgi:hypothetical protein
MTNPNAPQSNESVEKIKNKVSKGDINSLIFEWVKAELKNNNGVVDPLEYNNISYPDIYNKIRERMKSVRELWDTVDISDKEIDEIDDFEIIKNIEKFSRGLKNARRNLYQSIKRNIPNILEKIPNFNEKTLLEKIENIDELDLNKFYTNNKTIHRFISTYFNISASSLQFRDYDFMKVFGTDNLKSSSPDLYKRTENAAIAYRNNAISPDISLIRELIGFYGSSDKTKKKEICDFFNITVSLSDWLKIGLLTQADLVTIAKKEFESTWNQLDHTEQQVLLETIRSDDNIYVNLSDYDAEVINNYFDSKKTKEIMTRTIHSSLEKDKDIIVPKEWFVHDIEPEIAEDGSMILHGGFLKKLQENASKIEVSHLDNLVAWSVLVFLDEAWKTQYFKLDATDVHIWDYEYGVTFSNITWKQPGTVGWVKSTDNIDYNQLFDFLSKTKSGTVWTAQEFASKKTSDSSDQDVGKDHINWSDKVFDVSDSEDVMTIAWFTREINLLDPEGEKIWLSKGVAFASKWKLENGEEYEGTWNIVDIHGNSLSISNTRHTETISFDDFIDAAKTQWFRRIGKLETKSDLLSVLQAGDFNIDSHAKFDWHDLVIDDHGHSDHHDSHHDDHGHSGHEKSNKYEFFQSKSGWHIRINGFDDGVVSFGEYKSANALADVQKLGNAGKLKEKQKKWLYANRHMSYAAFVEYLKKNWLKATTDNILVPNANDTYHPHDPHLENSFLSKMWSYWSIADVMKGFGNLIHGVEHYFEKSSKLNASRVALTMWKKLWLPLDIMAQLQADEVNGVKEIIEKIGEKLKNLNGPIGRNKALHIAHTKTARPEEVGAAILHMVRWYGSLYAEDIAYAQWSESFINGLLHSCGFRWQALTDMKKKAREKSRVILGNEAGSDLSEEEMIWWFMKMMDGNYEKYPVAATLVKAMGGPSGFENAWRKDGFDGAYEKWLRQAGDLVNAEARVDHGLSALATHEYHTSIGSMEKAADKDPSPGIQTLPVVWALGWYSKYLSTKANQKIKWYADGKWHSFHAFSFLRTRLDNELYQYTFREALKSVAPSEVSNLDKYIKKIEYDGHTKNSDNVKEGIQGLARLWRNYHDKWLHDMLQWKNIWLIDKANKDPKIKEYFKKFSDVHQNNGGDEAHGDDNGWYIQHGYVGSPIVSAVDVDGLTLNSMERVLRKMKLDSHQLRIDKNHRERYWGPMVKIVTNLYKSPGDEKIKEAQFLQYRRDILLRFNEAFSSRWEKFNDLKKQEFYTELLDMGIDISIIFEDGWNIKQKIEKTAQKDLIAWKQWWYRWGSAADVEVQSVKDTIGSVISPRQDSGFQWKRPENQKDPEFNRSDMGW